MATPKLVFNVEKNKEVYQSLFKRYITRPGADKLLEMLDRTDFYTAPASRGYHGNTEGGLNYHSISVFYSLLDLLALESEKKNLYIANVVSMVKEGTHLDEELLQRMATAIRKVFGKNVTLESLAICGLCHDFHKLNYYEKYEKSVFEGYDSNGKKVWRNEPAYKVRDDVMVMGLDGTNSNYIISTAIGLTYEERLAIENHMGYISGMGLLPSASKAWTKSRLAVYLHLADMLAAYVIENPMED